MLTDDEDCRYQYSTCDPTRNAIATLPNLVNHSNITVRLCFFISHCSETHTPTKRCLWHINKQAYVDLWKPQIAAARGLGKDFVVGEYSSVSCSGKENVTNAFGQALWIADSKFISGVRSMPFHTPRYTAIHTRAILYRHFLRC